MVKKSKSSKKWTIQRLAPVGLWISGLAILVTGSLLVVKLISYIGLYTPTNQKPFNLALWISLGVAIIGPALFALLDPKRVRQFLAGRQARHGSNAVIMLLAFIMILVVVNVIVYQNPVQWDWTEDQQNSLAPETVETLKALPATVHAIGFYTSRYSNTSAQELFDRLQAKSNGKFDYEFIDPESNPAKAQQYNITRDGTIVLLMQGNQELLTSSTEQNITNSLVKLMNPGQRSVYFLTGHGERDIETSGDTAYTRAKSVLESKNYTVQALNLLAQNSIPEDALAVIISGPTKPISAEEMTLLKDYVAKGGSLIVLEDPTIESNIGTSYDPLVDYLTTTWGISLNNDVVIDPHSTYVNYAIENTYGSHPITNSLESQNLVTFYPFARSLAVDTTLQDITTTALVNTIDRSWGETDFIALQNNQWVYDASTDLAGPLTIAAAAENANTKGRVVVIGDSNFADDTRFDQYGNGDLFVNSVDWAASQEGMISLTAKQPITRTMQPQSQLTILLLAFAFVILIPGLIIAGGVASWIIRRRRG
ncbi:MAG: GldG family protein [Chloroflexota bacterium]